MFTNNLIDLFSLCTILNHGNWRMEYALMVICGQFKALCYSSYDQHDYLYIKGVTCGDKQIIIHLYCSLQLHNIFYHCFGFTALKCSVYLPSTKWQNLDWLVNTQEHLAGKSYRCFFQKLVETKTKAKSRVNIGRKFLKWPETQLQINCNIALWLLNV